MKTVLVITKTLSIDDGQGRYSVDLINRLLKFYRLIVFCRDFADASKRYVDCRNIEFHKLNNRFFSFKFLKLAGKADFIHSFSDFPYCLMPFWFNFLVRKPVFITVHGTYGVFPLENPINGFFLRRAYKKARKIFCISNFTKNQIMKRIKLDNLEVINNGVDYDKFQIIKKSESGTGTGIVLSVGALKPRKGYHISIPAVAEVKKIYPDIKYYIVGGKPTDFYSDLVKKYNLEKNIKFFINISDDELIDLYHQSDVFLLPSITFNDNDFEGFGLVYLEAGACGKPVIGTYGCGAEDAIIDGETGFLVPQSDIKMTSGAILKLINNPSLAQEMGESGRKRARQMSWENVVKKYIQTYEEASSNK
jgi:phosphatidyl-myo-inositol dimannoside synthase